MIPSVTSPTIAPKPAVGGAPPTASKTTSPPAPDTARGSIGETAAGNLKAETARAVDAPEQTAVAPRQRDLETAEQSDRLRFDKDTPTGPPPAFEESPLERQARVAFDPPETAAMTGDAPQKASPESEEGEAKDTPPGPDKSSVEPHPTSRERAEISFVETRAMSVPREIPSLDVSR